MITARNFAGASVGVFGLARSGLSAARALKAGDARIFAWDDNEEARGEAAKLGATVQPWEQWPWDRIKTLVLSPGVPFTHPAPHQIVMHARGRDVELIGDVELFARAMHGANAPVIAVTGTNGKSTTTALIGHILQSSASMRRWAAISASLCSISRRQSRRLRMFWKSRPTRSIFRQASRQMWRC